MLLSDALRAWLGLWIVDWVERFDWVKGVRAYTTAQPLLDGG